MTGADQNAAWLAEWRRQDATLCGDCPPIGYETDRTRCLPCPRRAMPDAFSGEPIAGWQPIETAPKDDGPILIYDPHPAIGVSPAYWEYLEDEYREEFPDAGEDHWEAYDGLGSGPCYPTHWMPLPPAPTEIVP